MIKTAPILALMLAVAATLAGCATSSDKAPASASHHHHQSPRATPSVSSEAQPTLTDQCADIARWTARVSSSTTDAAGEIVATSDIINTGTELATSARPEVHDAVASAVYSMNSMIVSSTTYNAAMDQLSTACAGIGPAGAFQKIGPDAPAAAASEYTLSVTGSGAAQVLWTTSSGSQQHAVTLPWTTTIPDDGSAGYSIILVGESTSGAATPISCSITEGSNTFASNTSSGAYATVSCSK